MNKNQVSKPDFQEDPGFQSLEQMLSDLPVRKQAAEDPDFGNLDLFLDKNIVRPAESMDFTPPESLPEPVKAEAEQPIPEEKPQTADNTPKAKEPAWKRLSANLAIKVAEPKAEAPKPAAEPKAEAPKAAAVQPKAETPKAAVTQPKAEAPKAPAAEPKAEAPKAAQDTAEEVPDISDSVLSYWLDGMDISLEEAAPAEKAPVPEKKTPAAAAKPAADKKPAAAKEKVPFFQKKAAPEKKPAASEKKAAAPEKKPPVLEKKPAAPEKMPPVLEKKPAVPEKMPPVLEKKPAVPEKKAQAPEKKPAVTEKKATAPKKKPAVVGKPGSGKVTPLVVILAVLCVLMLILSVVLFCAAADPYGNKILPGTSIGGIDVGGMSKAEARRAIKDATKDTFSQQPMEVTLPSETLSLSPDQTRAKLNVRSAVKAAYQYGRKGTDEAILAAQTASANAGTDLPLLPHLKLDQQAIRTQLETYAAQHNVAHTELSYHLEGSAPDLTENAATEPIPQTLVLTLGTPLEELDVDAAMETILEAYSTNTFRTAIETAYLTQPAAPDLETISQEFYVEPVNTTLDLQTYQQVPGAYGYALDVETGSQLLADAHYGDTIRIPMTFVEPEIWGDGAYFRDELGYCETPHSNNEDRNTNLTLACAALDGVILQPGEEFSYNDTVGERTKEKGYKPAAAYSGYNTVNSIGGGVCQVSTTLYNACLLSDMEIVFRVNHGYKSSYIAIGLDATVNWGGPDFKFRNNSHFPIMLKAEVSGGFVKVKILGTDEKDYYIKMTSGYSEDDNYYYSWSYKNKYDKETDELISREKEAYSSYMKH